MSRLTLGDDMDIDRWEAGMFRDQRQGLHELLREIRSGTSLVVLTNHRHQHRGWPPYADPLLKEPFQRFARLHMFRGRA